MMSNNLLCYVAHLPATSIVMLSTLMLYAVRGLGINTTTLYDLYDGGSLVKADCEAGHLGTLRIESNDSRAICAPPTQYPNHYWLASLTADDIRHWKNFSLDDLFGNMLHRCNPCCAYNTVQKSCALQGLGSDICTENANCPRSTSIPADTSRLSDEVIAGIISGTIGILLIIIIIALLCRRIHRVRRQRLYQTNQSGMDLEQPMINGDATHLNGVAPRVAHNGDVHNENPPDYNVTDPNPQPDDVDQNAQQIGNPSLPPYQQEIERPDGADPYNPDDDPSPPGNHGNHVQPESDDNGRLAIGVRPGSVPEDNQIPKDRTVQAHPEEHSPQQADKPTIGNSSFNGAFLDNGASGSSSIPALSEGATNRPVFVNEISGVEGGEKVAIGGSTYVIADRRQLTDAIADRRQLTDAINDARQSSESIQGQVDNHQSIGSSSLQMSTLPSNNSEDDSIQTTGPPSDCEEVDRYDGVYMETKGSLNENI